jgi:hypothetical protein
MKIGSRHRSTALIRAVLLSVAFLMIPDWASASELGGRGGPSIRPVPHG